MKLLRDVLGLGESREFAPPSAQEEIAQAILLLLVPFVMMWGGYALYRFAEGVTP